MKCQKCGHKNVYPITELDAQGVKRVNWRNVFHIDIPTLVFCVIIIVGVISYKYDMKQYQDIASDPRGFCQGACRAWYGFEPEFGFNNGTFKAGVLNATEGFGEANFTWSGNSS